MHKKTRRRVLLVVPPPLRGGAQLQVYEILRLLDRELFEPFVCVAPYQNKSAWWNRSVRQPYDVALQEAYRNLAVGMYEIPSYSVFDPRGVWQILKVIKDNKIDLLNVNQNIWGQMAGMLARVPIVQHIRVEIGALDAPKLSFLANYCTSRFSRMVIAVSAAVKEQIVTLWHVDRSKVRVVHSGVDIERFNPRKVNGSLDLRMNLGIGSDEKIVISVGNTSPVKGYQYFVQTASEISQQRTGVRFILVGDGPSLNELKGQAHALGLQENVLFLGRRADIPQLLAVADVFVLTSLNEASPGSVKEAMAMQLPVVATKVGGVPEVVEDKESGFLVPPRDPLAMAEKINLLLNNETLARAFGRRGCEIVMERFTSMQMVMGVEQVYKDVLGIV